MEHTDKKQTTKNETFQVTQPRSEPLLESVVSTVFHNRNWNEADGHMCHALLGTVCVLYRRHVEKVRDQLWKLIEESIISENHASDVYVSPSRRDWVVNSAPCKLISIGLLPNVLRLTRLVYARRHWTGYLMNAIHDRAFYGEMYMRLSYLDDGHGRLYDCSTTAEVVTVVSELVRARCAVDGDFTRKKHAIDFVNLAALQKLHSSPTLLCDFHDLCMPVDDLDADLNGDDYGLYAPHPDDDQYG